MKPDRKEMLAKTSPNLYTNHCAPYLMDYLIKDHIAIQDKDVHAYWKPGEWIWSGKIPRNFIHFDATVGLLHEVNQYFNEKKWQQDISDYPEENWDNPSTQDYFMENFLKFIWLLNEYTQNKGFNNPMSCHYNPRLGKIVIHPGGVRSLVEGLFGKSDVDCHFFNTGGCYYEFMENLDPWDLDEKFTQGGYACIGVPDHGSVIPHMGKDMDIIPGHKKQWYWRVYNRISEGRLKIKCSPNESSAHRDTDCMKRFLNWIQPWHVSDEHTVEVIFKNTPTNFDTLRAIYSIFAEIDYSDHAIEVVQK